MAEKTKKKPAHNKKRAAKIETERAYNKAITYVSAGIILAVIVLIGVGVVIEDIIKPDQPVAIVNGEEISTHDFQIRVKYERLKLVQQYLQYYGFLVNNPGMGLESTIQSQLTTILQDLSPTMMGSQVLNDMMQEVMIKEEAQRRGITVTKEEMEKYMQEQYNFFPADSAGPTPTATLLATSTMSQQQLALVTITPTYTPYPTMTSGPTSTPDMNVTPTEVPLDTPTATPYTEDGYNNLLDENLSFLRKEIGMKPADFWKVVESDIYRYKLTQELLKNIPYEEEMVWARHILVETEEEANDILAQLNDGGDFAELAKEYSTDTSNSYRGGDLGWFSQGAMVTEFADAAFGAEIGDVLGPIQTEYGFHIIHVLGKEVRQITEEDRQARASQELEELIKTLVIDMNYQLEDYFLERIPVKPAVPDAYIIPDTTTIAQ
ncbi:MAG: peptidylprolyl isomerase [Anaerolineales bacterium]|nr:peptidylprolyl isomerase [Anaerolineales bacterium]